MVAVFTPAREVVVTETDDGDGGSCMMGRDEGEDGYLIGSGSCSVIFCTSTRFPNP